MMNEYYTTDTNDGYLDVVYLNSTYPEEFDFTYIIYKEYEYDGLDIIDNE